MSLPPTKARPRIALFTKDFRGGGAERVMVHLARGLAEPGDLDVDLVVCKAVGPNLELVPNNVRVVDLHAKQMIASLPTLRKYLSRERPAALLSALEHANVTAITARALSGSPTRMVISAHNSLSQSILRSPNFKKRMEVHFVRAFYKHADAIVAVSKGVADDLVMLTGIDRNRIDVIYNPVISDAMIARSLEPLNHPWFDAGQPPVILNVGRLSFQKDQAMLLKAFAKLRKSVDARLLILGEGEERPALEALAQELGLEVGIAGSVLLPGFAENPYAYMAHSSTFALSSRYEGLPTVLIEALACGAAIVSTDCPSGPNEILDHGKWGQLTPVGDADAFAEALKYSITTKAAPIEAAWEPYKTENAAMAYRAVLLPNEPSIALPQTLSLKH